MKPFSSQLRNAAPWLIIFAALLSIVPPTIHLWPIVDYTVRIRQVHQPGYGEAFGERVLAAESTHFLVEAPPGYMSKTELDALLKQAEASREKLVALLEIPGDTRKITIRLFPEDGIPYCGTRDINIYAYKANHTSVVHEMTHYLMGYPNGLLAEGLAIMAEDRFGWGLSFPNMLRPVEAHLHNVMRKGEPLVPINDLRLTGKIYQRADPARSRVRYLQAASFSSYLAHMYGLHALLDVYKSGDFAVIYGQSLADLEQGWLASVRRGQAVQGLGIFSLGLGVTGLFALSLGGRRSWRATAWLGFASLFVWSYYLVYSPLLPAGLMAALAISKVMTAVSRRAGIAALWILMVGVLFSIVLLPALRVVI